MVALVSSFRLKNSERKRSRKFSAELSMNKLNKPGLRLELVQKVETAGSGWFSLLSSHDDIYPALNNLYHIRP